MPNWSEGSLRLRGKRDSIMAFVRSLEKTIDGDWKYIPDTDRAFVIEDVYRVEDCIEILTEDETLSANDIAVFNFHFCQAWGVRIDDFINISSKYHVDIRINTVERGMMFAEKYEIVDGKVTINKVESYKDRYDFEWNVPFSYLGG